MSHASTVRFSPNFPKRCLKGKQTATEMERCAEKIPRQNLKSTLGNSPTPPLYVRGLKVYGEVYQIEYPTLDQSCGIEWYHRVLFSVLIIWSEIVVLQRCTVTFPTKSCLAPREKHLSPFPPPLSLSGFDIDKFGR